MFVFIFTYFHLNVFIWSQKYSVSVCFIICMYCILIYFHVIISTLLYLHISSLNFPNLDLWTSENLQTHGFYALLLLRVRKGPRLTPLLDFLQTESPLDVQTSPAFHGAITHKSLSLLLLLLYMLFCNNTVWQHNNYKW